MKDLQARLDELRAAGLYRAPDDGAARKAACEAANARAVPFIDASSNDYLGLRDEPGSHHAGYANDDAPGAGASRLIHGTRDAHVALERSLASWLDTPAALLFSSGYAANVGVVSSLASRGDLVVSDELNHASLIDGCRLARAAVQVIPHLDLDRVARELASHQAGAARARRWVVVESYYSMDGDSHDLAALRRICDDFDAYLVVDEAHALGVFGPGGRGLLARDGVHADVTIGTFGKAFGLQGAFVAGSGVLREFLWNRARSFVFSTATSPLVARLALERLRRVQGAQAMRQRLAMAAASLRRDLLGAGLRVPASSHGPIVPVILGGNQRALDAAAALRDRGILTQAIRPPTVPGGSARLRLTLRASNSDEDLARLTREVVAACRE